MARFLGARPNRGDAYLARLQRMRAEGHAKGSAEGKLSQTGALHSADCSAAPRNDANVPNIAGRNKVRAIVEI
jgi:hypothetical protein